MKKLLKRLRELRKVQDERGTNLVEVVVAMALFSIIGSTFVFAMVVIQDARVQSGEQTKATISQGGISNSFRSDIGGAKGLMLDSSDGSLNVAKRDGSCVRWTVNSSGADSASVIRAKSDSGAIAPGAGSVLSDQLESGSLSLTSTSASLNLNYSSGDNLQELVNLNLSGTDGGACW